MRLPYKLFIVLLCLCFSVLENSSIADTQYLSAKKILYSSGSLKLEAYLCMPEGEGPFPAVIYNHGGKGGQVGGVPVDTCKALAKSGFVGFSPIRGKAIPMNENLRDVLSALDYVQDLNYVDPNKIGVIGFSRGGHLALLMGAKRRSIKALVVMAAAPGGRRGKENIFDMLPNVNAPVLLLVSENDHTRVNHVELMKQFTKTLRDAGKEAKLIIYPPYGNDGHRMFFKLGSYWRDVIRFLETKLK